MSGEGTRVVLRLLRHGQVPHHRGDVPLTELGVAQAEAAGEWFEQEDIDVAWLLSGETNRTVDAATAFARGYRRAGGAIDEPVVSFGLRNPDLYLGGHRINMGEGAAFLAEQSPGVSEDDVLASTFYRGLVESKERVGYWLEHANPPGETARDVGRRIDVLARSLGDIPALEGRIVVAITHSPVLRAVRYHHWGEYSREPPFLHGYDLALGQSGDLGLTSFETSTGDIPATSRPGPGVIREEAEERRGEVA